MVNYSGPHSYTPKHLADKILADRRAVEGERKLVTVLFADVAGFTAISEKLDPEEVHGIMDGCCRILAEEIHRMEGTIGEFRGDGVMALFGAPLALEDHAQRAGQAALAIQKAMVPYGEELKRHYGIEFKMRIGVNSGLVVVGRIGDDLRMDYTAMGDTTNLAARMETAAEPGGILVSAHTFKLIEPFFALKPRGPLAIKGKKQPQEVYELLGSVGIETRIQASVAKGLRELIGRGDELETLQRAFEAIKKRKGRVVDIVGEAGIGKSRLMYEFQKTITGEAVFLAGACVHYGQNMNFLPVIEVVRSAFGIEEGQNEEEALKRMADRAGEGLAPLLSFYQNLLSLKVDDPKFQMLNPEGRKYGTFEAVKNLLLAISGDKPLVILLEDAHWIDKISEELFTFFSKSILDKPVLLLTAYRPEASPSWTRGSHYQRLGLMTLDAAWSTRLVRNLTGGVPLEAGLEKRIVDQTGGNPFFVEEVVRELIDRGDIYREGVRYVYNPLTANLEIPATVHGVLSARMDRLSEEIKQTMQVAAVIGREFPFRILKTIMELGDALKNHLTRLVELEILEEKSIHPEIEYIFKHALTQEVAYETLLKQSRSKMHGRVAQAIEEHYKDHLEKHYELLAFHYEKAEDPDKAVYYLVLAGEKSTRNLAAQSAYRFFRKALDLSEEKQISFGPEREVQVHQGLAQAGRTIGDLDLSMKEYQTAIALSRRYGLRDYEAFNLGEISLTLWLSQKDLQLFDSVIARAQELGDKIAESQGVCMKGFSLCTLGHRYEGSRMVNRAETMALQTGEPRLIALVRLFRGITERWLGNPAKAIELTEGGIEMMRRIFSLDGLAALSYLRGLSLAEIGRNEEAIKIIKEGIDIAEKFGNMPNIGRLFNSLAYCYSEVYHPEKAQPLNRQSQEVAHRLMERYPAGRQINGEVFAQANVNLMENLFDQNRREEAWNLLESFEKDSMSDDYSRGRDRWQARKDILAYQMMAPQNKLDAGLDLINHVLDYAKREHIKKYEGRCLRILGELDFQKGLVDSAIEKLNESIALFNEVGNPRQLWEARASLGRMYDQVGRVSEAGEQWGAAAALIQVMAEGMSDRELREGFLKALPVLEIKGQAER